MIIVWDCKTGRREFIEMLLKKEGYEVFSSSEVSPELIQQIQSFNPVLIIASESIQAQIDFETPQWIIGKEIELPIEPLSFLDNLSKKLR